MDDRYLWDKTGPVDPHVERLERALGRFRHERRPLRLDRAAPRSPRVILAAAAAVLAAAASRGPRSRALHPGGGSRACRARRSPAPLR
jgi:hypothetical protein